MLFNLRLDMKQLSSLTHHVCRCGLREIEQSHRWGENFRLPFTLPGLRVSNHVQRPMGFPMWNVSCNNTRLGIQALAYNVILNLSLGFQEFQFPRLEIDKNMFPRLYQQIVLRIKRKNVHKMSHKLQITMLLHLWRWEDWAGRYQRKGQEFRSKEAIELTGSPISFILLVAGPSGKAR